MVKNRLELFHATLSAIKRTPLFSVSLKHFYMHIPGKLDACRQYPVFQYKNNATLFSKISSRASSLQMGLVYIEYWSNSTGTDEQAKHLSHSWFAGIDHRE